MMFDTLDEFRAVTARLRPRLDAILARHGLHGPGWADVGGLRFLIRQPVGLPADPRRQPIFGWSGTDRFAEAWRDAGFQARQLSATDIHTPLRSRMPDAISAPALIVLANQRSAEVPHLSTLRWVPLMRA